jgi:hypothetical protein
MRSRQTYTTDDIMAAILDLQKSNDAIKESNKSIQDSVAALEIRVKALELQPRSMQMPGQQHGNLKSVTILGFCFAKNLVELTCYVVENTLSLESLTLDIHGTHLVSVSGIIMRPMYDGRLVEAPRTLLAIRTYIQEKIPSTVKLNVLEPCGPCNTVGGANLS